MRRVEKVRSETPKQRGGSQETGASGQPHRARLHLRGRSHCHPCPWVWLPPTLEPRAPISPPPGPLPRPDSVPPHSPIQSLCRPAALGRQGGRATGRPGRGWMRWPGAQWMMTSPSRLPSFSADPQPHLGFHVSSGSALPVGQPSGDNIKGTESELTGKLEWQLDKYFVQ